MNSTMKARFTMMAVVVAVGTVLGIASLPPLEDPKTGPQPTALGSDVKPETTGCKIRYGHVVGLKSGGPNMTVKSTSTDCKIIYVEYFDKDDVERSTNFKRHMLRKMN